MAAARGEAARFLRFALVGGIGFAVDAGLLSLLHNGGGLDPYTARLLSVGVAAFTTWRLNRRFTFGMGAGGQAAEGLRYALVAALTAALNYVLYAMALMLWPGLPPLAALVAATAVAMGFSYAGYGCFVFAAARPAVAGAPRSQRR